MRQLEMTVHSFIDNCTSGELCNISNILKTFPSAKMGLKWMKRNLPCSLRSTKLNVYSTYFEPLSLSLIMHSTFNSGLISCNHRLLASGTASL